MYHAQQIGRSKGASTLAAAVCALEGFVGNRDPRTKGYPHLMAALRDLHDLLRLEFNIDLVQTNELPANSPTRLMAAQGAVTTQRGEAVVYVPAAAVVSGAINSGASSSAQAGPQRNPVLEAMSAAAALDASRAPPAALAVPVEVLAAASLQAAGTGV